MMPPGVYPGVAASVAFAPMLAFVKRSKSALDAIFDEADPKPSFTDAEHLLVEMLARWKRRYRLIEVGGDPYLLRLYLMHWKRDLLPGVFLHCFLRGDNDRDLHNHPWKWALSVILTGGYVEERRDDAGEVHRRTVRPGAVNLIRANDFHRVELLDDRCWTLFIAGPRLQQWGFWNRDTGAFTPAEDSAQ